MGPPACPPWGPWPCATPPCFGMPTAPVPHPHRSLKQDWCLWVQELRPIWSPQGSPCLFSPEPFLLRVPSPALLAVHRAHLTPRRLALSCTGGSPGPALSCLCSLPAQLQPCPELPLAQALPCPLSSWGCPTPLLPSQLSCTSSACCLELPARWLLTLPVPCRPTSSQLLPISLLCPPPTVLLPRPSGELRPPDYPASSLCSPETQFCQLRPSLPCPGAPAPPAGPLP